MSEKTNVIGATKVVTQDGSAAATVTLSMLKVNTEINSKPYDDGTFVSFLTSLFGPEYGIKKLERAMNDINLKQTQFGVSAQVSIYVKSPKQLDYLTEKLQKGAKLRIVHARATYSSKYGLKLTVNPSDIAFIETSDAEVHKESEDETSEENIADYAGI